MPYKGLRKTDRSCTPPYDLILNFDFHFFVFLAVILVPAKYSKPTHPPQIFRGCISGKSFHFAIFQKWPYGPSQALFVFPLFVSPSLKPPNFAFLHPLQAPPFFYPFQAPKTTWERFRSFVDRKHFLTIDVLKPMNHWQICHLPNIEP